MTRGHLNYRLRLSSRTPPFAAPVPPGLPGGTCAEFNDGELVLVCEAHDVELTRHSRSSRLSLRNPGCCCHELSQHNPYIPSFVEQQTTIPQFQAEANERFRHTSRHHGVPYFSDAGVTMTAWM